MGDFLFHKVSDKEREEIKKQAKEIIDNFSDKLSKLNVKVEKSLIERSEGEREESKKEPNEIDRDIFFENASHTLKGKNKDFILGEKGAW